MPPRLGIVAGGGALPGHVARGAVERGREVFIVALEHHADPSVVGCFPHVWVRIGAASEAIGAFRQAGVAEIVLAGAVRRPSLAEIRPDRRAARLLAKGVLRRGDDGLLGAIVKMLETEEGFRVLAAQDIVDGLLAGEGVFTARGPDERETADIDRGIDVLKALGAVDVGQAAVVQNGMVLGIEAVEGTDSLIVRTAALRRDETPPVLVKMAKPGQERRVDLPVIGSGTIEACIAARFAGIAVSAGACLIVDRDEVIRRADEAGVFLEGRPSPAA